AVPSGKTSTNLAVKSVFGASVFAHSFTSTCPVTSNASSNGAVE
ncbi:hypothetical protein NT04LS_3224a, partial [Listeria seeligeri FSL S4-171]